MIKKSVLTSLFVSLLASEACFAAFEYNGIFASGRQSNDPQTYYILLNENTKVSFSLKDDNGNACKDVFISKIKLSSDETKFIASDTGIDNYTVSVTGIYEVEVKSNIALSDTLSYTLNVDEDQINTTEKQNAPQEISAPDNTSADNNFENSVDIGSSSEDINLVLANTSAASSSIPSETNIATSSEDIEQIEDAQTFMAAAEPLSADTPAIEENVVVASTSNDSVVTPNTLQINNDIKPVEKKELKLDGNLQQTKSIDIYDFISDKSKCWPKSICVDDFDNIWVLDGQLNKIHCYDINGSEIRAFGSKGKENFALGIPVSIAYFQNKILVGDRQKHCIHVFDTNGNWITAIQSNPTVGLKINNPVSICVRNNEIWIGDSGLNRMLCFDSSFTFLGSFGSTNEGKIESIASVSTDGNSFYILEEEGCIKIFGPMGNFEAAFDTEIKFGTSVFIDNKNVWVVDSEKGGVMCFSNEGSLKYSINREKLKDLYENSDRFTPAAFTISHSAKIIVADTASKQLKIFEIK